MLSKLGKTITDRKRRIGRGGGSRRGGKSGRGTTRHQTAREKVPLWFEGGQGRLVKRFPLLRGKGKNKAMLRSYTVRLEELNIFEDGATVDINTLQEKNIIGNKHTKMIVKVVLKGELKKKLSIALPVTSRVREAVEKIGGTIITV